MFKVKIIIKNNRKILQIKNQNLQINSNKKNLKLFLNKMQQFQNNFMENNTIKC